MNIKNNINKIDISLKMLKLYSENDYEEISGFLYKECGYKLGSKLPDIDDSWKTLEAGHRFCGNDRHFWLRKKISLPSRMKGKNVFFKFCTDAKGWDAWNPQGLLYINGRLVQGLDINHTQVKVDDLPDNADICVYLYSGARVPEEITGNVPDVCFTFGVYFTEVNALAEKVYYDIKVLYDILCYTDSESKEYCDLLRILTQATDYIDFRKPRSELFNKSLEKASEYLDGVYNSFPKNDKPSVTCIGHTHIDIAWLWTVAQTREKAQRSFGTVINLMKRYPEYKFMSSQPLI